LLENDAEKPVSRCAPVLGRKPDAQQAERTRANEHLARDATGLVPGLACGVISRAVKRRTCSANAACSSVRNGERWVMDTGAPALPPESQASFGNFAHFAPIGRGNFYG
jgi:hypothetical protein